MWFLPTLFLCNLAMFIVFKLSKQNDFIILVTAIVSLVLGYFFLTDNHIFMGINTVFVAYPMCIFGYYLKSFILNIKKNILIVIGVVSSVLYLTLPIIYRFKTGGLNYINMFESKYCCYFYDMIIVYAGILSFYIFFQYIKFPKFVIWFGKNTLFYYAFHIPACNLILSILQKTVSADFNSVYLNSSLKLSVIYTVITFAALILLCPVCLAVNKFIPFAVGLKKQVKKS